MHPIAQTLLAQLTMLSNLKRRIWQDNQPTLEELVLRHGVGRVGAIQPHGNWRGEPRACFYNATRLTARDPQRWVYCEGYAIAHDLQIIVGEHAWVLDRKRNDVVVELTWELRGELVYLGIPFAPEYLFANVTRTRYGLLDAYWARWPLRTLPKETYLHPQHGILRRDFDGR